jgi:hypothetical protein
VALGLILVLGLPLRGTAWAQPVGSEFQVSTYTTSFQSRPAVAADSDGDFVVVWNSNQDGSGDGIFGQRYTSAGAAVGSEFQVNTYTTSAQYNPAVAADSDGDFVVVWNSGQDGSDSGIFGQRYTSAGAAVGSEFQVNTYTTSYQFRPAVAADSDGDFVVVWGSFPGQDGSDSGIFGQRYTSAGAAVGSEFQVNTYTTSAQYRPAVAADSDGDFVVVWGSYGQDGSVRGIFGQRYTSAGAAVGSEFQVNTYTTHTQYTAAVAADSDGDFVVVWNSYQDGSSFGIFGQRYTSAGAAVGSEFQVNTYTTDGQVDPAVAADSDGDFVVVWTDYGQDGSGYGTFGQRYTSAGAAVGCEFQVNTYTTSAQYNPAVAADSDGDFVVVWTAVDPQDGNIRGTFGQRFQPIVPTTIAAPQTILGKQIKFKHPASNVETIVGFGKEVVSTATVVGNPLADGASVRIIANGTVDQDATFNLPPCAFVSGGSGWVVTGGGTGYLYKATGIPNGVKMCLVEKPASGTFQVKCVLKGNVAGLEPPGSITDGSMVFTINGGNTYCVTLGGAAGGTINAAGDTIRNATAETACPPP